MRVLGQVAGQHEISNCLERLRRAGVYSGGRFVKVTDSDVMMVFDSPDGAAAAASRMHATVERSPTLGAKLGVKVAFETGPVIVSGKDVLGDTVKLAAHLVHEAQRGQTLTSQRTAEGLSPSSKAITQHVHAIRIGSHLGVRINIPRATTALRLQYGTGVKFLSRGSEAVVIGRDPECGLPIENSFASRRHCTVQFEPGGFVICDHSSNGSYLTNEGSQEIALKGQEAPLAMHGWVAFGQPRILCDVVLEFLGR